MYNQPHNRRAIDSCFSGVSYAFSDIQAVFGVSSPKGLKAKPPT